MFSSCLVSSAQKRFGLGRAAYCSGNIEITLCCHLLQVSGRKRNCADLQCYYGPRMWLTWSRSGTQILLGLVGWVAGFRLMTPEQPVKQWLYYCDIFKSFCILFWELLAKDEFSKRLEGQTVLNLTLWKATCIARVFKVAVVTLWKVMGCRKISLMFSISEKLHMEWLSLLLVDSFYQTKEGTGSIDTTAPEACCHLSCTCFPPCLKCLIGKPRRSCITALYKVPCCLWNNDVWCVFWEADRPTAFSSMS